MKFKETPIGKIPEDWDVVRLGDISKDILTGATPLRANKSFWENGKIPWLTNEEVEEGGINYIYDTKEKVTRLALEKTNIKLIPPNSLILSLTASVGKVAINKIPITTNQQFNSFVLDVEKVHPEFLAYYFIFAKKRIELLGGLTTFKFISKSMIANFQVPLPPLLEQQKIAEILSTVDKAIQKVDEAIAKTEKLKKGLMQELLTRGIGHTEFKDTEIGRIPKEWEVVRLGKVSNEIKYGVTASVTSDSGIPVLRVTDINDDGYFEPDSILCVKLPQSEVEKYRLKVGDLVIARSGATAGKVAIYEGIPEILCFASYLIKISPKESVFSKFLFYFLNSEIGRTQLFSGKRGSAQPNINSQSIKAIKVPLPPLEEQQKIAKILSTVDKKLELERKRKEKLERIKRGLMNDLLTGRRRVKVG